MQSIFVHEAGWAWKSQYQQMPTSVYKPCCTGTTTLSLLETKTMDDTSFGATWSAMKNDLAWKPRSKYAATHSRHKVPGFGYPSVDFDVLQDFQFPTPTPSASTLQSTGPVSPMRKASKANEAVKKNHWLRSSNVWHYAAIIYRNRLVYPLSCISTTSGLSKSLMGPLLSLASNAWWVSTAC